MPTLNINGKDVLVNADASTPILWALRDTLGMTGTKFGCGAALCGACMLSAASVLSKSIIPGALFPIGIVTALIGVPFFIWLILGRGRKRA